jgi:predicted metal-dependent hydrolase
MKITLSKQQWQFIGNKTGWIKKAQENINDQQEKSLKDKMSEATHLSLQIVYATITPDGTYLETKDIDLPDKVWAWADGLTYKYYETRTSGKTSMANIMNFDIEQFEKEIDRDIAEFKLLLKKVGIPKKLTKEEMIAKGYQQEEKP